MHPVQMVLLETTVSSDDRTPTPCHTQEFDIRRRHRLHNHELCPETTGSTEPHPRVADRCLRNQQPTTDQSCRKVSCSRSRGRSSPARWCPLSCWSSASTQVAVLQKVPTAFDRTQKSSRRRPTRHSVHGGRPDDFPKPRLICPENTSLPLQSNQQ